MFRVYESLHGVSFEPIACCDDQYGNVAQQLSILIIILLVSNDWGLLHEVKQFLSKNFDIKDMGDASYVIGIKIHRGIP